MTRLENPFRDFGEADMFVYNPFSRTGMGLAFFRDGERVVTRFEVAPQYAGMPNILHGGAAATLLDEVMFWTVVGLEHRIAFTINLDIHYCSYVRVGEALQLEGRIVKRDREQRFVHTAARLIKSGGETAAEAEGRFLYPVRSKFMLAFGLNQVPPGLNSYLEPDPT